jgi:hypothetical protein
MRDYSSNENSESLILNDTSHKPNFAKIYEESEKQDDDGDEDGDEDVSLNESKMDNEDVQ